MSDTEVKPCDEDLTAHTLTSLLELAATDEGREQIRVMVAELRGFKKEPHAFYVDRIAWRDSAGKLYGTCDLPGLSLDSLASAEAGLTDEEHAAFQGWLILVCEGKRTISASALHRSIAFILTKQETKGDE